MTHPLLFNHRVPHLEPLKNLTTNLSGTVDGVEPLTLSDAREHLRMADGDTSSDAMITRQITSARQLCERLIQRTIQQSSTRTINMPRFDRQVWLPYPPLLSVTQISYEDTTGTVVVDPATYEVISAETQKGSVEFVDDPPIGMLESNAAIMITYTAGYATIAEIPEDLKDAVRFQLDILMDNDLTEGETRNLALRRDELLENWNPGLY